MLHQIGIGALGPVFRTYEPARDRLIAVKVFRLDIVPEQAQALAQAMGRATEASLFHPSIVEPIAAGMEGTVAYRAEEYVAAESLDVAMRHYAPAALDKVLPFITQLAGAIDFARAAGVGHGGLHPRDIFVTPDDARATGFGVVEALEEVGIRAPTRRPYAAPERIDGGPWSTQADVFSLAAITFELLTGRRPSGTGAQIGALPEGDHAAALHAVLARAMDDDPVKRFGSALAFAAAIEAAGHGDAAAVPPQAPQLRIVPPPPPPAPKPPAPEPPALELPELARPETTAVTRPPIETPTAPPIEPPAKRKRRGAPIPDLPPAPPLGEFEVEKRLDPVLKAIDDDIAAEPAPGTADHRERLLFDEEPAIAAAPAADDVIADVPADLVEAPERFAPDEFVEAQAPESEARRPLEAVHESAPPLIEVAEAPMYPASEPDSEPLAQEEEEERSHILPYAVVLVLGLLGGFGAAWFLINRGTNAAPPAAEAPAATTPAPATPAPITPAPAASTPAVTPPGPATAEKPGQYSEQKVTPAAPSAAPPAAGRRTDAVPARGRLVVTSTPSHAGVTVNGTWRGRTPLTLDDLAPGTYVIRVVQSGFAVARDEVTLTARNASHVFNARLERAATPATEGTGREGAPRPAPRPAPPAAAPSAPQTYIGSLYVDSRPRGATVYVDGRSVGVTPLTLSDVAVGSHVVKLELAGKKPWSTSTQVTSGQTARVTGSLEDR